MLTKTPKSHRNPRISTGALRNMLYKNPGNKRKTLTTTILLTLLVSALAVSLFVNLAAANPVGFYYPRSLPPTPIVKVIGLNTDKLTLTFSIQKTGQWITPYGSIMFGDYESSHVYEYTISVLIWVDGKPWSPCDCDIKPITVSFEGLSNGWHTLEVIATASGDGLGWHSSQGSSGAIQFQVDTPPPSIHVLASQETFEASDVPLNFTVNRPVSWVGYSLDGKENVTINQEALLQNSLTPYIKTWTGNLTLAGLSSGSHNLIVYAKDQFGNTGASATKEFTVEESAAAQEAQAAPLPIAWITTAIIVLVATVSFGLVAYFARVKSKRCKA
jgi:multisubunit Na+/H+ antiporter MnhC subunit